MSKNRNDGDKSIGRIVDVLEYGWIPGGPWNVRVSGDKTIYATFKVSVRADDNHCSGICILDVILQKNGIQRLTRDMVATLRANNVGKLVHLEFFTWDGWTFEDWDELDLEV